MNQQQDRQEIIESVRKLIGEIHIAMLTTRVEGDTLRSRPMITAKHDFDGNVWFFTAVDDPKVAEIKTQPQVNVAYSSPNNEKYVSLSGRAELVTDRKYLENFWTEEMLQWFPNGLADKKLALLRIDVTEAEYWNHKAGRLGGLVSSLFNSKADESNTEHRKIRWEESVTVT
jgi:general stress protein 26